MLHLRTPIFQCASIGQRASLAVVRSETRGQQGSTATDRDHADLALNDCTPAVLCLYSLHERTGNFRFGVDCD